MKKRTVARDKGKMQANHQNREATDSTLDRIAGSTTYGVLTAALATTFALVASLALEDIRASWPIFHKWPGWHGQFKPDVMLFWLALFTWVLFYSLREHTKGKQVKRLSQGATKIKKTVAGLQLASNDIKDALQTLPPVNFISDYAQVLREANLTMGSVLPRQESASQQERASPEELADAIRGILTSLGGLASTYDSREVDYGANVMIFVARDSPNFSTIDQQKIDRYLPPGFDHAKLKGVLHLRPELAVVIPKRIDATTANAANIRVSGATESASSNAQAIAPTPQDQDEKPEGQQSPGPSRAVAGPAVQSAPPPVLAHEVVFGIPQDEYLKDHGGRWRVLPGSPMAFVQWNSGNQPHISLAVQHVHDFQDLRRRVSEKHEEYDLDPDVVEALEEDYCDTGPSKLVRSFLAFPVVTENGDLIGTLNIHCNEVGILGNTERGRIFNFVGVVLPLVHDVAALVDYLV